MAGLVALTEPGAMMPQLSASDTSDNRGKRFFTIDILVMVATLESEWGIRSALQCGRSNAIDSKRKLRYRHGRAWFVVAHAEAVAIVDDASFAECLVAAQFLHALQQGSMKGLWLLHLRRMTGIGEFNQLDLGNHRCRLSGQLRIIAQRRPQCRRGEFLGDGSCILVANHQQGRYCQLRQ